jgi:hypothetical protein
MDVAPPLPGSRIQELRESLLVHFRPHRSWGSIAFLLFWLTCWTGGGLAAAGAAGDERGADRAFLLLWLGFWALGELLVVFWFMWELFGRELLAVTRMHVEHRQTIGPLRRTTRVPVGLVRDVRAELVPTGEEERRRTDYCVHVSCGKRSVLAGERMDYREAQYVASMVQSRMYDVSAAGATAGVEYSLASVSVRQRTVVVFIAILAVALAGVAFASALRQPRGPAPQPAEVRSSAAPSRGEFANPRGYAAATTRYALTFSGTAVLGRPVCDDWSTWDRWGCNVTARANNGPYARRRLVYRCTASSMPRPGGGPPVNGTLCGPEHPPEATKP